jgi:hypothetical protein
MLVESDWAVNWKLSARFSKAAAADKISSEKSTCIVMCGTFIVKHGAMISQQNIVESLSNCMALKI